MKALIILGQISLNYQNLNYIVKEYLEKIDKFILHRTKNIGHFLRGYDTVITQFYEILEEDKRRSGASKDITSITERAKIYKKFTEILSYLDKFAIKNLPKNRGYFENHVSPTKSFHVAMYDSRTEKRFISQEPYLEVTSPFIGAGKERGKMIHISMDYPEYVNSPELIITLWAVASELHHQPSKGFFVSNIVHVFISEINEKNKEVEIVNPNKGDLFIGFPLKIAPVKKNLKKYLKCYVIQTDGDGASQYYEHHVSRVDVNDSDEVKVWCGFEKVVLKSAYFAVAYEGDVEMSKDDFRLDRAKKGDVYVIDDYVAPKMLFEGVFCVSIVGFILGFFNLD